MGDNVSVTVANMIHNTTQEKKKAVKSDQGVTAKQVNWTQRNLTSVLLGCMLSFYINFGKSVPRLQTCNRDWFVHLFPS